MKAIADEILAALAGIPELYFQINPRAQVVYPYATFGYSYTPSAETDGGGVYDVTLEVDIFDRGANALRLLDREAEFVYALKRYRALRPNALSIATMNQALDVPTLVDGLHRRHLQFTIRMTLRK